MVRQLEYVKDKDGKVQSVVIPYEDWVEIEDIYTELMDKKRKAHNSLSDKELEARSMQMFDDLVNKK